MTSRSTTKRAVAIKEQLSKLGNHELCSIFGGSIVAEQPTEEADDERCGEKKNRRYSKSEMGKIAPC